MRWGLVPFWAKDNNGIPPTLKNLLDHFLEEYFFRPSAIGRNLPRRGWLWHCQR
jgi:hypothetical protein